MPNVSRETFVKRENKRDNIKIRKGTKWNGEKVGKINENMR